MSTFMVHSANVEGENNLYLDMCASKISLDGVVKEYVYYRISFERQVEDGGSVETLREGEEYFPLTAYEFARERFTARVDSKEPHVAQPLGWTLEAIARQYKGNSRPGFNYNDDPRATPMPRYTQPPDTHPPLDKGRPSFPMKGGFRSGITN